MSSQSDSKAHPDLILYTIIPGQRKDDESQWVRIGALWQARKGYSGRLERLLALLPPFVGTDGIAAMPFEAPRGRR